MPKTNEKTTRMGADRAPHSAGNQTTNQGVGVANTDDSLKAGKRGPTLMEDFIFREKITHFDHERIPERIVHARGSGAHGYFQVYESLSHLTKAHFLSDPALVTPVFVRFSTVAGSRGSADTVRDVRGFAVKFYTQQGNYDIVGNNMPVFFIQDAIKFPDLIHAVKPEPNNEMPQAASAHDTFWDFVVNTPESMHTVLWLMSPRALPQSYRMMEGFGIHTFRFVNADGESKFVKFHWKPLLGVHSLVWDEAQKIAGKDADFNRRDLWNSIAAGHPAEFEFGIQVLDPKDEFKFGFDILDCTKLWPEELVPVQRVGKMTLNENPQNFFAETEQAAFCPANIVPGIDFTNDPLLQGRLFSYLDTQLSRLGGPNFHQIPINRPLPPVNNDQRDGIHQMRVDEGQTAYHPNALNRNEPHSAHQGESAFAHLQEKVDGSVIRERSESFRDHFSQAAMFWNSMSAFERKHIIDAFRFELGKCTNKNTRQRTVDLLGQVNAELAGAVAEGLGIVPAKARPAQPNPASSPALSIENTVKSPKTRRVAILIEQGFQQQQLDAVTRALAAAGAQYEIISAGLKPIPSAEGKAAEPCQTFATAASVLYDAVFVPGGAAALAQNAEAKLFVEEAYRHFKTIGLCGEAAQLLAEQPNPGADCCPSAGVVVCAESREIRRFADDFIAALAAGRHYQRAGATLAAQPKVVLRKG
ncbi:MAG: catalase [Oscillospiraceae bacterium]|jgi:catalase|nr:catalase [Oscillospiraceae bacterium]